MKFLIIDFSQFNGIRMMYATHYYLDGKRVSARRYAGFLPDSRKYEHISTRQWTDTNKNGVRRDYTEILYRLREAA